MMLSDHLEQSITGQFDPLSEMGKLIFSGFL